MNEKSKRNVIFLSSPQKEVDKSFNNKNKCIDLEFRGLKKMKMFTIWLERKKSEPRGTKCTEMKKKK